MTLLSTNLAPAAGAAKAVRVLIVDDSAVVRQVLTRGLSQSPGIEVVGVAPDPYIARDKIIELRPDVVTLDVEMPRMDGISFLRKLMQYYPLPVIILSSLTQHGTETALAAMEAGAVEVLAKPGSAYSVGEMWQVLAAKIKLAARSKARAAAAKAPPDSKARPIAPCRTTDRIIALGASTGGVQALTEVLSGFPASAPPTVIVQHMPEKFTASFANRLDQICRVEVREARDGDRLFAGRALLAPGGRHMVLQRSGAEYFVSLRDGPEVFHQKPSVEVLFESVAIHAGANAVGAILTGMGADGAGGLLKMRQAGARTLAEDQRTCVVFGMPAEAIKLGAAERIVPLDQVASVLLDWTRNGQS